MISTNTIAQGSAREDGLDVIIKQGGSINHAVKSMKWPGLAAVEVSLVTVYNGAFKGIRFLNKLPEQFISAYLDNNLDFPKPYTIQRNCGRMFKGVTLLGDGFLVSQKQYEDIISLDRKYLKVIFPYLNGQELNDDFKTDPKGYCISFFDFSLEKAKGYEHVFSLIEQKVKPLRGKLKDDNPAKKKWWLHERSRMELYNKMLGKYYTFCKTTKYLGIYKLNSKYILSQALFCLPEIKPFEFTVIQCTLHEEFARKLSPTLKT